MPWLPPCLSHFLIFYIHCSQFGNRSKWRRRRAAVVIATAKWQTTRFGWNKKSWIVVGFFSFFFLIENIPLLWKGDTWLTLSFLDTAFWLPLQPLSGKGGLSKHDERRLVTPPLKSIPSSSPLLRLSFVFIQQSTQPLSLAPLLVCITNSWVAAYSQAKLINC